MFWDLGCDKSKFVGTFKRCYVFLGGLKDLDVMSVEGKLFEMHLKRVSIINDEFS